MLNSGSKRTVAPLNPPVSEEPPAATTNPAVKLPAPNVVPPPKVLM